MSGTTADTTGAGSGTTGAPGRVETDELREPIASDAVGGTPVYDRRGERSGAVHASMMDERSGRAGRAAMEPGRRFYVGGKCRLPSREALTHDTRPDGPVARVTPRSTE